jgi:hypothetical protein
VCVIHLSPTTHRLLQGGWKSACNDCYNTKGYSEAYREREREKDEAGFLARNAASHLAWVHANPERIEDYRILDRTVPDRRLKRIRSTVEANGNVFVDDDWAALLVREWL